MRGKRAQGRQKCSEIGKKNLRIRAGERVYNQLVVEDCSVCKMSDVVIETSVFPILRHSPSETAAVRLYFTLPPTIPYITYSARRLISKPIPLLCLLSLRPASSRPSPSLPLFSLPLFLSSPHCVCLSDPVAFCCAMKGLMPHSLFSPLSLSPLL